MARRIWKTGPGIARVRCGPLVPYLDAFGKLLFEEGYKKSSARQKIRLIVDLSHWLDRRNLAVGHLSEQSVGSFLKRRHQTLRNYCGERVTLNLFLKQLRDLAVIPLAVPCEDVTEIQRADSAFCQYLLRERGLAPLTVRNYAFYIRRFLSERFGEGTIRFAALTAADIHRHILSLSRTLGESSSRATAIVLRHFFRFLRLRGDITTDLTKAVPRVAHWKLATIPKYLKPEQVEAILNRCDQETIVDQRDYTVLLLLARLGLRGGEVVAMQLDDIDWDTGELTIRGKGGQQDRLPIPKDVGRALAFYLRHGRPSCLGRHVFVRLKAPHREFATSSFITYLVEKALQRAELDPIHKGARILRHSLATCMLRKGASLADVGEVLRHRSSYSTGIYAKVDLNALRALAKPWPGGKS